LKEELKIQSEILGQDVSVIFDGTSRLGEALAIVLCFVTSEWSIDQRLIKAQLLSKSLKGEELARELIHTLTTEYGIGTNILLAAMRDRASSNGVAMKTLMVLYPKLDAFHIQLTEWEKIFTLLFFMSLELLG